MPPLPSRIGAPLSSIDIIDIARNVPRLPTDPVTGDPLPPSTPSGVPPQTGAPPAPGGTPPYVPPAGSSLLDPTLLKLLPAAATAAAAIQRAIATGGNPTIAGLTPQQYAALTPAQRVALLNPGGVSAAGSSSMVPLIALAAAAAFALNS